MHASDGVFNKGLGFDLLLKDVLFLAACIPVLWMVSALALSKQER
jgi:ribosome-dependent ATPase